MNVLDILIGIILLFSIYNGVKNGLIISIFTLIGLIGGLYAAFYLSENTALRLSEIVNIKSQNMIFVAYILNFIVVIVLVTILGKILTSVIKTVGLGILNRIGGLAFGVLKGALIASFLLYFVQRFDKNEIILKSSVKEKSILYAPISKVAPTVIPMLNKALEKNNSKNEAETNKTITL